MSRIEKVRIQIITQLRRIPPFIRSIIQYIIAVLLPFLSLGISFFWDQMIIRANTTLFFFPAIAFSAWNGGYMAGTVTTVLSAGLINYFYISQTNPSNIALPSTMLELTLFILEGIAVSIFIHFGQRKDNLIDYIKREKDLKEKVAKLEKESISLQKEIQSRDEFLSIASHELKTPLTSMLLQTQHALHNIRNVSLAHFSIDSLLKMLESVENQTRRLSRMINDLLNISLMTTGNFTLEYDEIDMDTIIQGVLIEFTPRLEREKYKLSYTKTETIIGRWDKVRIEQALSNLISNAIKYGKGNPIDIEARKQRGKVSIIVKDHGIGITKETQKKIFDLFERGVSPDEYKGLGVGLYITRQIINAHGGEIYVTSKPGVETEFLIQLPLLPKQ